MTSVRDILRSAREERQLSLEKVQGDLGIPLHYLEAIEGRSSKLIADEFYLVPFLRRYADFLGLDGATLVARFLSEAARNEAAAGGEGFVMPGRGRRWVWVVAAAAALVAGAAWWLWPLAP